MTNVGKGLRAALAEAYTLDRPQVVSEQVSKDGTRKWLIRMAPTGPHDKGAEIECVYIPETDRGTLCVSSQVGCTLTCSFCHTGTQRLVRNLTSAEIVAQLVVARDRIGDWPDQTPPDDGFLPREAPRFITNIVFMGMGEPLYNTQRSSTPSASSPDNEGLGLSRRRITRLDVRRRAADRAPRRAKPTPCWRFRCTRCATNCATSWCRSTANTRSRRCSMPAAPIRACRMRAGSRSNT